MAAGEAAPPPAHRVPLSLISHSSQVLGEVKRKSRGCGEEQGAGAELHVWG